MKVVKGQFPSYAAGRCDFVTKNNKVKPNEKTLNLQMNVEDIPDGALCVHERTVKQMVGTLGWKLQTKDQGIDAERLAYLELRVLEYEKQLATIKESLPA